MGENMASSNAPILSTPAEHILDEPTPATVIAPEARLSDEQLHLQYEIRRTVNEIRTAKWRRIALQFPDEMLIDAPRVYKCLEKDLTNLEMPMSDLPASSQDIAKEVLTNDIQALSLAKDPDEVPKTPGVKLCILADTSYGACCVDEVAAEHVDAEVVVHYGRACLSPTARLPVIYVFTSKPLDLDVAVSSFKETFQDRGTKVCLMADIPYSHHLSQLSQKLHEAGYTAIFQTTIVRNPSSLLPNRTVPLDVDDNPEKLKEYSIFHLSSPPTSLLLVLSSRVKSIHVFPTDSSSGVEGSHLALEASTAQLLRRRYALTTRLSTVPIFGILINTLSVSNYLQALQFCQDLISRAGKKYYVFVVGKVNAAKVANFSEIGGWVVIGCWESSLIESKDFYRPIITPFELEVALTEDKQRVWGAEWVSDFSTLLGRQQQTPVIEERTDDSDRPREHDDDSHWDDQPSDDEPPEFDLRTGKYVSHSRPIGRPKTVAASDRSSVAESDAAPPSSALVQRPKGDVALINGALSPAAEFLRSQRTWQGLGSDYEIMYERDDQGKIRGATMEEGRSGIARGYTVGDDDEKS